MDKDLRKELESEKIIAILRGVNSDDLEKVFEALINGGIKFAEITLNTNGALSDISRMREIFKNRIHVGAGTVLNRNSAEDAVKAGAEFLVAPNVDKGMIECALSNNVVPIPGAMTPTEVCLALNLGAEFIKIFPISVLGAKYIKELKGPFNNAKLIAVGSLSVESAVEYLKAGASGFAIGGKLVNKKAISEGNFEYITKYALDLKKQCHI